MATQLQDGAVYCLGLTPYQYVARKYEGVHRDSISWVLVPVDLGSELITGPVLFVDRNGKINRQEGVTEYAVERLHFTGRYAP